ncbi:MAG: hypothetical protein K2G97_04615, partial [Oscillospiraceae bacterium]|nr:hypothetical protein [Oscillospiraceae bacterium]
RYVSIAGFCFANSGEISSCKSKCSVKGEVVISGDFVGINSGKIENCSSNGNLEINGYASDVEVCEIVRCFTFAGALVGTVGMLYLLLNGKEANTGGFCGNNSGEINFCDSDSDIKASSKIATFKIKCGGFVGDNSGKINSCISRGSAAGQEYVGGFCGSNTGDILSCKSRCYAKASTKINTNICGGFVGENRGKIKDSMSNRNVTGEEYVGGFVGVNKSEISDCNTCGKATAKTKIHTALAGGFVGENSGKVNSCISTGNVEGQEYVGGFCGDNKGEISKSNSEGNAKAETVSNTNRCGGFIGENGGIVKDSNAKGSATGEEYVGGFAGVNKNEISDCNAQGKATAKTKTHTALAGGFVGENEKGKIANCTATGGADSRSNSGPAKAGGFVGTNKASIVNSNASGYVYLSAGTCYKDNGCGGFVGNNDQGGSIEGCYAEATVETTNKKKGGGFVGEAEDKSSV